MTAVRLCTALRRRNGRVAVDLGSTRATIDRAHVVKLEPRQAQILYALLPGEPVFAVDMAKQVFGDATRWGSVRSYVWYLARTLKPYGVTINQENDFYTLEGNSNAI
jgi:hypothetical protein